MDGSEIQRIPFNSYKDPESKQNGKKPRINFNYSPNIVRKSMPLNTKENKDNSEKKAPKGKKSKSNQKLLSGSFSDTEPLSNDTSLHTESTERSSELTKQCCCFEIDFQTKACTKLMDDKHNQVITFRSVLFKLVKKSAKSLLIGTVLSFIYGASFLFMTFFLSNGISFLKSLSNMNNSLNQTNVYISNLTIINSNSSSRKLSWSTLKCHYCYLILWTTTSCLVFVYPIYLLLYFLGRSICKVRRSRLKNGDNTNNNEKTSEKNQLVKSNSQRIKQRKESQTFLGLVFSSVRSINLVPRNHQTDSTTKWPRSSFFLKVIIITALCKFTGYAFMESLNLISKSSVVALYSVNYSFLYMSSWIVLQHKFLPHKLLGFILSFASFIFILYSNNLIMDTNLIGNFLAIGAAITSALLQTMWKNSKINLDNNQLTMLTSLVGVCNICIGWPLILLLHYTGEESLNFLRHLTIQDLSESFYIWSNFLYAGVLGITYTTLIQFGPLWTNEKCLQIATVAAIIISVAIDEDDKPISSMKMQSITILVLSYILLIIPDDFFLRIKSHFFPEPVVNLETSHSLTRRYKSNNAPNLSPVMSRIV